MINICGVDNLSCTCVIQSVESIILEVYTCDKICGVDNKRCRFVIKSVE